MIFSASCGVQVFNICDVTLNELHCYSASSSFSSISTKAACRFAWEPSLKKTFLMTPALGARMVCCTETDKSHK